MADDKDPMKSPITWAMLVLVLGMFATILPGVWSIAKNSAATETGLTLLREEVREGFRRSDARIDSLERRITEGQKSK